MTPRLCIPISARSTAEAEIAIDKALKVGQLFELYPDYIEDLSPGWLSDIAARWTGACVLTWRRPGFHPSRLSQSEIEKYIGKVSGCFMDFDVVREKNLCEFVKVQGRRVSIITSYHNYESTPSLESLHETVNNMTALQPDIYKVATVCTSIDDSLRLIALLRELTAQKKRVIVTGMREHGLMARVLGGWWGSEWVYAPLAGSEATAPGQISAEQLRQIYSDIAHER